EKSWRDEVRRASVNTLLREHDLLSVLLVAKSQATASEPTLSISDQPEMTVALLASARSETLSQTFGSRAVRRSGRLAWDVLVDLYGGEATLKARIEELRAVQPQQDDLIALAEKYLKGWRPDGDAISSSDT